MRILTSLIVLGITCGAAWCYEPEPKLYIADNFKVEEPDEGVVDVERVVDGDTVKVSLMRTNGASALEYTVRLEGIDAPERKQPYGPQADMHLGKLLRGKEVVLVESKIDKYGRTVGKLYVDGEDVNLRMVMDGYAWHYVQYAKNDAVLAAAQSHAQANKHGLWKVEDPEPPWEFRRKKRLEYRYECEHCRAKEHKTGCPEADEELDLQPITKPGECAE